jgi:sugar phosphate isomerase/epimerase
VRLSISNIAWDIDEDERVSLMLARAGVDAIDIAPGKYFPDPAKAGDADIAGVRRWWADRGIEISGMQALLFGTTGLNVFGSPQVQRSLLDHLAAVSRIGAGLGATRVVFGSPKNRDRSGLDDQQALDAGVSFFRQLGAIAQQHGVVFCLEPNPTCYGANFMTTSAETAHVVASVDHPAIRMQLDTGALTINGEDVESVLASSAPLVGHIHASEPDLMPLGDCATDHRAIHAALRKYLPQHIVAIEMVATRNEGHLTSIERALTVAIGGYRPSTWVPG